MHKLLHYINRRIERLIQVAFSVLIFNVSAAQKISGKVVNETGRPAGYVKVQFSKTNTTFTNEDGTFNITAVHLPDTLYFIAPGFESYSVVVNERTVVQKDFEVVLLNTRRKMKPGDNITNNTAVSTLSNSNQMHGGDRSAQGYNATAGSYIVGKKLYRIDSAASTHTVMYRSGLLAAGEINDFSRVGLWRDFTVDEYATHSAHWNIYSKLRYEVQVQTTDDHAIVNRAVYLIDRKSGDTSWSARTDNTGKAELWAGLNSILRDTDFVLATSGADAITAKPFLSGMNRIKIATPCNTPDNVDIAFVVDATGSMNSEIDFLKVELENVVRSTFASYQNLRLHVGAVFYRDRGDEYVTRHADLQDDLLKVLNFIKLQRAAGGGDVPEAVHSALSTALDSLTWSDSARTRILFLITDAPPHDEAKQKIFEMIQKAAARGTRIVPVLCRGADKSTEFIMRFMALATNGTYLFLTDDANASFVSADSATTHAIPVQFLSSLMKTVINQMIFVEDCGDQETPDIPANLNANSQAISVTVDKIKNEVLFPDKSAAISGAFIADCTGKIIAGLQFDPKQKLWRANVSDYPYGTYLLRYVTKEDRWGASIFEIKR